MIKKRIIPCLDVKDGTVVKGIQFKGLREIGDPVELAKRYNALGADELVFLDISATETGHNLMIDVIRKTAQQLFIPMTIGGGIKSTDDISRLLNAGADKVSLNSSALANPATDQRSQRQVRQPMHLHRCRCEMGSRQRGMVLLYPRRQKTDRHQNVGLGAASGSTRSRRIAGHQYGL